MKLVATSDFINPRPESIKVDGALNDKHIHKGARFQIGGELPLEKLPQGDKALVALLNSEGRIVDESQTEKVKLIDKEVADETKKAKAAEPKK